MQINHTNKRIPWVIITAPRKKKLSFTLSLILLYAILIKKSTKILGENLTLVLTTIFVCLIQTAFHYVKDKIVNKTKVRKEKYKK